MVYSKILLTFAAEISNNNFFKLPPTVETMAKGDMKKNENKTENMVSLKTYSMGEICGMAEYAIKKAEKVRRVEIIGIRLDDDGAYCDLDSKMESQSLVITAKVTSNDGMVTEKKDFYLVWNTLRRKFTTCIWTEQMETIANDDDDEPVEPGSRDLELKEVKGDGFTQVTAAPEFYIGNHAEDFDADKPLPSTVNYIRMDYPFPVKQGSYNAYKIKECHTWKELLDQIQRVIVREYRKDPSCHNHEIFDYVIERIVAATECDLVTVFVGS